MNETYKKHFLHAGSLAKQVRAFGKALIVPGASYNQVIAQINKKIIDLGAIAAFPPQIALNDIAAHFLPRPGEDILFTNEVIKLDVGVCYQGAIGDCAVTVDLSGKYQSLIDATEAALLAAEKSILVGLPVREIGKIIEQTIDSYGFTSIKNLSGHGLGHYKIHTPPMIPNYDDKSTAVIKAGMTFAIEPFATTGRGFIFDSGNPTIFAYRRAGTVQSPSTKALLAKIKTYIGLPFAMHDLIDANFTLPEVIKSLDELIRARIINGYAPLIEETHGLVAQAENSVLIDAKGEVFITTR